MLCVRVLSAIVLLPVVMGFLALGGWWFFALISVGLLLAGWEFVNLMRKGDHAPWLPAVLLFIWVPLLDSKLNGPSFLAPAMVLVMIASLSWAMVAFSRGQADPTAEWSLTVAGGLYLGLLGMHFVRLRELEDGLAWSVIAFGSTWLADVGAYLVGRQWGRRKLAPKLSPGKTIEGSIGALVMGVLGTAILAALLDFEALQGALLGLLISAIYPQGALGISMIKRQVGAKDTGKLIPGHGGVLDRMDSLLISVTVATYFVTWVVQ